MSWGFLEKYWLFGIEGSGLRKWVVIGKRNCLCFCCLGILLVSLGSWIIDGVLRVWGFVYLEKGW